MLLVTSRRKVLAKRESLLDKFPKPAVAGQQLHPMRFIFHSSKWLSPHNLINYRKLWSTQ